MSVKIIKDDVPILLAAIEGLTRQRVLVGIPGNTPARTDVGVGISNAVLGYINEFGSPAANIPARPWLMPGIQQAMPAITARLRAGAVAALKLPSDGEIGTKTLMAVGLTAQNVIRAYVNTGIPPALAAATISARRNRKVAPRTGTKPLIDTGQFRNSISYVIRNK